MYCSKVKEIERTVKKFNQMFREMADKAKNDGKSFKDFAMEMATAITYLYSENLARLLASLFKNDKEAAKILFKLSNEQVVDATCRQIDDFSDSLDEHSEIDSFLNGDFSLN